MAGAAGVGSSCSGGRFVGQWPAGSPWVTAVGGTGAQSHTAMLSRAPSASTSACLFVCLLACALTVTSALLCTAAGANPEVVAGLSSGGFSDRWAQARYAASAALLHVASCSRRGLVVALPTDRFSDSCGTVGTAGLSLLTHSLTQALMGGGGTRQCAVLSDA
jgi:hypothetical protein